MSEGNNIFQTKCGHTCRVVFVNENKFVGAKFVFEHFHKHENFTLYVYDSAIAQKSIQELYLQENFRNKIFKRLPRWLFAKNVKTKNAEIEFNGTYTDFWERREQEIEWINGVWLSGSFKGLRWKNGTFINGIMCSGYTGNPWKGGTWIKGKYKKLTYGSKHCLGWKPVDRKDRVDNSIWEPILA